ncbi:SDR family NAD(P)-dependent oxidoreductase [Radiobacillus deserti]|nr:SDR family NAD(P)-dependent oxidoreductase [Radiobacillus deserti]
MPRKFNAKSTADQVLSGVDLKGKRFFITGVSSGIGLETARSLVSHGASVVGTLRDIDKSKAITSSVFDAATQGGGSLELIDLDLASLQSVRVCADTLLTNGQQFDAIIANAGVMATPFGRTVDGFEVQFGTNYLGHFALINRIEPLIADNGRLVMLSSQAHRIADVDLDDPNFEQQTYDPFVAYGRSKTATTLFAAEFDKRHRNRGIRAASVMPGNSLTNLPRHFSQEDLQGLFENAGKARAEEGLPPMELKEVAQAAATSVWAAVVADKDEIGGRYLEDCAVAPIDDSPNPFADGVRSYALDASKAEQLWVKSEEMVGTKGTYPMKVIGIIGAGEVGSQIARAAIANGYEVVIANSRGPETLKDLIDELGPSARAATAAGAAEAGDFVVVAVPLKLVNDMPVEQLAGKIVLDTNNYMPWRDGHFPVVDSGEKTVHELRQEQLPNSKVAKAFTHIQASRLFVSSRPAGAPDRHALSVSSNFPEAVELVTRLYDQFGFDTVDNSPLSESWRSGPGQPAWAAHAHQTRAELIANLARARRII